MESLFRKEAVEQRRQRLAGNVILAHPPVFKLLSLLILAFLVIGSVFLSLKSYARKESVSGVIQPSKGFVKLKAPSAGIVSELLVKDGQDVNKGQTLLRIISEKYGKEGMELNSSMVDRSTYQLTTLEYQLSQLKIRNQLELKELKARRINLEARLAQIRIQQSISDERIGINKNIVEQISSLANTGYISEIDLKRQADTLLSLRQQTSVLESQKLDVSNQLLDVDSKIDSLPLTHKQTESVLQIQIEKLKVDLSIAKYQHIGELRTPVDGRLSGVLIKENAEVESGQKVVSILPKNSEMQAVVFIPSSDIAFVEAGQEVNIRYHAFPHEKFGMFAGTVSEVSTNVYLPEEINSIELIKQPSYKVVIDIESKSVFAYGREFQIKQGMRLDADIILDRRSLLEWLFEPVYSIAGRL